MSVYQTIVLSGGGSKGAFGLGALLALEKYHSERAKKVTKIYCGTSVGALNATLAAQGELEQLQNLYATVTTKDVLGTSSPEVSRLKMLWVMGRRPFHYFKNAALRATIQKYANYSLLADSHLLICATNFITGDLETFYVSRLVDQFLEEERQHLPEKRRLVNYRRIGSQEELVDALLASSAIPFYFPPVKIGNHIYVDGGVGNNTPLRQAAYLCRFIHNSIADASLEPVLCVINDPSRFTIGDEEARDVFGVIRRTMDIFHNELVRDSHLSWDRINDDVRRSKQRESLLGSTLDGIEGVSEAAKSGLKSGVADTLRATSTSTPRKDLPLLVVRPNTHLVDNILCFDPKEARRLKEYGAEALLQLLLHRDFITGNDFVRWNEQV